jgi:hypothetical protein
VDTESGDSVSEAREAEPRGRSGTVVAAVLQGRDQVHVPAAVPVEECVR